MDIIFLIYAIFVVFVMVMFTDKTITESGEVKYSIDYWSVTFFMYYIVGAVIMYILGVII